MSNGIKIDLPFTPTTPTPIDTRTVVETIAERNAIDATSLYEGLEVYVKEDKTKYRYNGTDWKDAGSGGGSVIDDTQIGTNTTYSSEKIYNLVSQATGGRAVIDDTTISSATVFSSEKINADYVSKINLEGLVSNNGFIKNTVDNLINYYNKTESYSKDEVNNIIGNLNKLDAQIVASLPTENISTSTIYLIEAEPTGSGIYNQYMHINNEWASLGSTAIDLTEYVKNTDLATVATSGSYNDLEDTPTIPAKVSQLNNDSGFTTIDDSSETATTTTLSANKINSMINDKLDAGKVQTTTGSETNDSVYCSKLTKDELDKKANDDEVVKKTDISTTIDSTSTDDKVPSAKTINTELDKINNNLGEKADVNKVAKKIYIKDVSSEDARTLIQNHWNEFDRFEFYNLRIDTAKWAWNAEIYAHTQEYGTVLLMSYGSDVPTVFYGKLYNSVWTWKEFATVDNVKDVGVTTITPVNGAITGTIEYTVNKGICYVSLFNVKSTINDNDLSISTTMPKPAINSSSAIVKQEGSGNIGFVYINKNTTQLKANIYIADIIANCMLSYPVAES